MPAPSEAIKALITARLGVVGPNYTIEIGALPATPDEVVVVRDTQGLDPNPRWLLDFPSVQMWVRGKPGKYLDTYNIIRTMRDICLGKASYDYMGDRIVAINLVSDIAYLGMDENNRSQFTINLALIVEPAASADTNREPL